ncbi:hypothetical protein Sfum_4090 [Syntrophobacter fumaroxidans MPOB]|uniref:Uncharacterized protein n=1 Tax=Syntrophobacter fumaroxidans (strain DSM 10017 / MPOB) TaxID=335543 RepID=A0LQQ3_SYNFM|nr:hypothetical protein Sfum_4090 [Syntrophobacter fumaroxidans MPOB]
MLFPRKESAVVYRVNGIPGAMRRLVAFHGASAMGGQECPTVLHGFMSRGVPSRTGIACILNRRTGAVSVLVQIGYSCQLYENIFTIIDSHRSSILYSAGKGISQAFQVSSEHCVYEVLAVRLLAHSGWRRWT